MLVLGSFAALTIPRMAQPGMFLDGLTYAAVSRNLAEGLGTFWVPFYTSTLYPAFHEQPPLALGLQSLAFALFGDHLWVERAYSLTFGVLTAVLMIAIWRSTVRGKRYEWLPIVFWLLPSAVTWAIVNNMLETTQAVLTTTAVLAFIRSIEGGRARWAWALVAGMAVCAAVLAKGPVGFFPLAAPVIVATIMPGSRAAAVRSGLAMIAITTVGALAVLLPEGSRAALSSYWDTQVLASLTGARAGGGRASLWRHLIGILIRMGALVALIWGGSRASRNAGTDPDGRKQGVDLEDRRWAWFFVLLALAGSLPLAVSPRIAGHYFVPSIPFYALGLAALSVRKIGVALEPSRLRAWSVPAGLAGGALLVASVGVPLLAGPIERRNVDWISEYRQIEPVLPRGTTLGTCEAARTDWGLHAYMQRLFHISLDADWRGQTRYYLQLVDRPCETAPRCEPIASSRRLRLLDCGPSPSSGTPPPLSRQK